MTEPNIDTHEVRFEGTITLDQEAQTAIELEGLAFMVVAVTPKEVGALRMVKGEVRRKDVVSVTDARVMLNGLREQGVEFLAGRGELEDIDQVQEEKPVSILGGISFDEEVRLDEDFDNVVAFSGYTQFDEPERDGIVGGLHDYKKYARPEASGGSDGPKTVKFQPEEAPSNEREQIGSVHDYRKKGTKDPIFAKFMEEGDR